MAESIIATMVVGSVKRDRVVVVPRDSQLSGEPSS
jgi:hypothetical protein